MIQNSQTGYKWPKMQENKQQWSNIVQTNLIWSNMVQKDTKLVSSIVFQMGTAQPGPLV